MKVLVLGGYGAVGAEVVAELHEFGAVGVVAGRDPARAERVVDLAAPGRPGFAAAAEGVDVVVNASGLEDPGLAVLAGESGAAFVDITATTAYVAALERLDPSRPVLVSVGLAPGLTNLLAVAAFDAVPGPIDLAVLLGAGERHGAAATAWSYGLFGRRFPDPAGGQIRNFTQPRRFDLPGQGRRRLYRADFSDQHVLSREFGVPVRTYFGVDSAVATAALAVLTWVPGASRAPRGVHLPGSDRWLALARAVDGSRWWAEGRIQSHATAVLTALAARASTRLAAGVHHLHHVMALDDVPPHRGVDLGVRRGNESG